MGNDLLPDRFAGGELSLVFVPASLDWAVTRAPFPYAPSPLLRGGSNEHHTLRRPISRLPRHTYNCNQIRNLDGANTKAVKNWQEGHFHCECAEKRMHV